PPSYVFSTSTGQGYCTTANAKVMHLAMFPRECPSVMRIPRRTIGVGLCVLVGACGANPKPQVPATPPPAPAVTAAPQPPPAPARPLIDPIDGLIATSQAHFQAGEQELKAGHLD